MRFDILTIFPQAFDGILSVGVIGQAREAGQIDVRVHDLREFADPPHRVVDDRPYGGGAGMVMKVDVFVRAIESVRAECAPGTRAVLLSPQGKLFRQQDAARWSAAAGLILLCGRYEGVDERLLEFVDEEVSIGDYVLTGGELPAAVIVEATARMTPGVVGKFDSVASDSFYGEQRLGPPHYTRPPEFRGLRVPEVLLSGDHAKIEAFRERQAWKKTMKNRPDLAGVRAEESDG
jgi:tRNA (guanine37-N1)-methyltransferase